MKSIQQEVIDGNINPYDLLDLWKENSLSKDDIESLGFVQSKFDGVLVFNKNSIGIDWMPDCPSIVIITDTDLCGTVPTKRLFYGFINNKYEFKVLLKQLGI